MCTQVSSFTTIWSVMRLGDHWMASRIGQGKSLFEFRFHTCWEIKFAFALCPPSVLAIDCDWHFITIRLAMGPWLTLWSTLVISLASLELESASHLVRDIWLLFCRIHSNQQITSDDRFGDSISVCLWYRAPEIYTIKCFETAIHHTYKSMERLWKKRECLFTSDLL